MLSIDKLTQHPENIGDALRELQLDENHEAGSRSAESNKSTRQTLSNLENNTAHQVVHQDGEVFDCDTCGDKYDSRSKLDVTEMKQDEDMRELFCRWPLCGFTGQASDVRRHVDEVHGEPFRYPCLEEFCKKMFSTRGESFRHYKQDHLDTEDDVADQEDANEEKQQESSKTSDEDNFECDHNNKESNSRKDHLDHHIQAVHEKIKRFPCPGKKKSDSCGKVFTTKANADMHYRKVHLKIRILCRLASCDKTFYNIEQAREHYRRVHDEGDTTAFRCSQCDDKSYNNPYSLRTHMKRIHECRYQCTECDMWFADRTEQGNHKRLSH